MPISRSMKTSNSAVKDGYSECFGRVETGSQHTIDCQPESLKLIHGPSISILISINGIQDFVCNYLIV